MNDPPADDHEYAPDELVPIPAKCQKCKRNWIDRDAIRAPSLDNCRCFYCGGKLVHHPQFPRVVTARERREFLIKMAEELRPAAMAANAGVFAALAAEDEFRDLPLFKGRP